MSEPAPTQAQAQRLVAGLDGLRLDLEVLKASLLQLNSHTDALLTELRAKRDAQP